MTPEELTRLKAICDAAAKQIWNIYWESEDKQCITIKSPLSHDQNMELLREARTAMPVLIKEVEKLREKLEIAKEALDQLTYKKVS